MNAPDRRAPALARNNVNVRGAADGATLVFTHGFGCDQTLWRLVEPAFRDLYRTVCLDFVGSGASDRSAYDSRRYSSLDGHADDLLEICEALDLQDATLVAHSVSCMIGMLAALRSPRRFRRLVFVAPSPCYLNDPPGYRGGFELADLEALVDLLARNHADWAGFLAPLVMGNGDRPELSRELRDSLCSLDPAVARDFARATFFCDLRYALPRLRTEVLLLQCRDDAIAPSQVGDYLLRVLPAARLVRLQATGHCPHVSHPQELIGEVRRYLVGQGA